jgi:phosphoglucomutase
MKTLRYMMVAVLKRLTPEQVIANELAGEKIEGMLTMAPGNGVLSEV